MAKPFQVTIRWGSDQFLTLEERPVETYTFETEAELNAFRLGVAEMDGWIGYEVLDKNGEPEPTGED